MRRATLFLLAAATFAGPASAQFDAIANAVKRIEAATSSKQVADIVKALPSDQQAILVRAFEVDRRIVGGHPVKITDVPWQVALIHAAAPEPVRLQFCGGTLIAPDVVLTAAHCVDNALIEKDASRLNIVSGTALYPAGGDRVAVTALSIHPSWNPTTVDYDFAVLKLARAVTAGTPVPIQATEPAVGTTALVSGWGATFEGGRGTDNLLAADMPIVERGVCNQSYAGAITDYMICAGARDGGYDACQGDSGGPLIVGIPGAASLAGVVSWGEGCGRKLKYGVYSNVAKVTPWIKSFSTQIAFVSYGTNPAVGWGR